MCPVQLNTLSIDYNTDKLVRFSLSKRIQQNVASLSSANLTYFEINFLEENVIPGEENFYEISLDDETPGPNVTKLFTVVIYECS